MGLKIRILVGFVFTNTSNFIWFKGVNGYLKLVVPYQTSRPINLHKVYIIYYLDFRNDKGKDNLLKGAFTKFQSNRFGG
jgi:hypothetical protein